MGWHKKLIGCFWVQRCAWQLNLLKKLVPETCGRNLQSNGMQVTKIVRSDWYEVGCVWILKVSGTQLHISWASVCQSCKLLARAIINQFICFRPPDCVLRRKHKVSSVVSLRLGLRTPLHLKTAIWHPKLNQSNPGFWALTNPGLRVWKLAGYPGFRVPGFHSLITQLAMCAQG